MKRLTATVCLLFILSSCTVPSWRTLPESNLYHEQAWNFVILSLLENNFPMSIVDKKSGYIETGWRPTKKCMVKDETVPVPCERARALISVVQWTPFKIKLQVERQIADIFSYDEEYTDQWGTHYKEWKPEGNYKKVEKELIDTINEKLKAPYG